MDRDDGRVRPRWQRIYSIYRRRKPVHSPAFAIAESTGVHASEAPPSYEHQVPTILYRVDERGSAVCEPHLPVVDAELASSLACVDRNGVTAEERALANLLLKGEDETPSESHNGLLLLGLVREIMHLEAGSQTRQQYIEFYHEALAWRRDARLDTALHEGLPPKLSALQDEILVYGSTQAGLPVFVEVASSLLRLLQRAQQMALSPDEFAVCRAYQTERYLQLTDMWHASGEGNGSYVLAIDFSGFNPGVLELRAVWTLLKAALMATYNYTGYCTRAHILQTTTATELLSPSCLVYHSLHTFAPGVCRHIFIVQPPRICSWLWRTISPLIAETTKQKFTMLPSGHPPCLSDFSDQPLLKMTAQSLPRHLGGAQVRPRHVGFEDSGDQLRSVGTGQHLHVNAEQSLQVAIALASASAKPSNAHSAYAPWESDVTIRLTASAEEPTAPAEEAALTKELGKTLPASSQLQPATPTQRFTL